MTTYTSPVPMPALDAKAPEVYREYYGMSMFVKIPTADLAASRDFWVQGLGFIDFFSIPAQLTHLRRWAFQDVLLVPGEEAAETPVVTVSFSCVVSQIEQIAIRCEELRPGCTSGPREMPWNSLELTIITPENARVEMTAAQPIDPHSAVADNLRAVGFDVPKWSKIPLVGEA